MLYRHLVSEGWFDRRGLFGGLDELGRYELAAGVFMLIVAFVPFFAFGELGRVIGKQRLAAFFFSARPGERSVEA